MSLEPEAAGPVPAPALGKHAAIGKLTIFECGADFLLVSRKYLDFVMVPIRIVERKLKILDNGAEFSQTT